MKRSENLSTRDIGVLFLGIVLVIALFLIQKQATNESAQNKLITIFQQDVATSYEGATRDLQAQDLKKLKTVDELFKSAKSYKDVVFAAVSMADPDKERLYQSLEEKSEQSASKVRALLIIRNIGVISFFTLIILILVMRLKSLGKKLSDQKIQLIDSTKKRRKITLVAKSYESKWKTDRKQITLLEGEKAKLAKEIRKADVLQKEMKGFIDTQIETNEQLMIAESQLKSLLEKEKESKAILNQTLERLKDTQGQLVHSEKMASLGQLTAGIAHEINNPINFVFNGIDSLRRNLEDLTPILDKYDNLDSELSDNTTIQEIESIKAEIDYVDLRKDLKSLVVDIKEGAVRTIEIVKGLRVFSRLDEEDMKDANINECLDATLVLLKNKTKGRIEIIKEYDDRLPEILCYPGQLNQVFMNIINNAIQAIPEDRENAEIKVSTTIIEEGISISLKDNGTGMSDEVKQRIFEPFFTTKPVGVGTGLGMSISYGIIEKHQGRLRVESEIGVGTEFIIELPTAVAPALSEAS